MGGADAVLRRAREDFAKGEYRWVAQALDHVVFADPANREARELEADALEQLGYQAESAPWRNFFLTGAQELRFGTPRLPTAKNGQAQVLPPRLYFAWLAVRLDGRRAQGRTFAMRISLPDRQEAWTIELQNGVLHASQRPETAEPDASMTASMPEVMALFEKRLSIEDATDQRLLTGDASALAGFLELLDEFRTDFSIVEP
jgi:alkyl sulfatase BDS1-like metallo-beta-lactamase superfamily hydrolase